MPPNRYSRHRFTTSAADPLDGNLALSEREAFTYRELSDNRVHPIVDGDTLHKLAGLYFAGLPRPSGLWWIIADFQPIPIYDPTIPLSTLADKNLIIPSVRTVQELILTDRRAGEDSRVIV